MDMTFAQPDDSISSVSSLPSEEEVPVRRQRLDARGEGSRGARGRGRGRRPAIDLTLSQEDSVRIERQWAELVQRTQSCMFSVCCACQGVVCQTEDCNKAKQAILLTLDRVAALDLERCHDILSAAVDRDPSLMLQLLNSSEVLEPQPPNNPPVVGQPDWCMCSNCRKMPTIIERKCCGNPQEACISMCPEIDVYILQPGHLRLARRIWNDVRAQHDAVEVGESNRQFRFAAYRQYIVWQYGALGRGHHIVIESCVIWRIRDSYPDPHNQYKGFIPGRI